MLERVRKALGRSGENPQPHPPPPLDLGGVMPPLAPEDYQSKFEGEWEKAGGIAYSVSSVAELDAVLQKILELAGTQAVALSRNPLLEELRVADRLTALGKFVTTWSGATLGSDSLLDLYKASFGVGAGITGVEYVLAESGSIVLTSATEGIQVVSLAPPVHIALYRRRQLAGSLDEVLERLARSELAGQPAPGRSVVIITGTSRTADIEQILIRGVHGPSQTHAILVADACG